MPQQCLATCFTASTPSYMLYLYLLIRCRQAYMKPYTSPVLCSTLHKWTTATGWSKYSKWGQGGDLYEQCVGHCLWWCLEQYWCYCGVSTTRIFHWRLKLIKFSDGVLECGICHFHNPDNTYFISTDAVAFSRAHFGAGIGTIYLDNVGCTGSETRLIDCSRSSTVTCFGGHSEDAGVRCQG